jgi:hypothetical protein
VVLVLLATIGPPFVLLSSHGPLLQEWRARWPGATNPYRLSIPSNLACIVALLGFPLWAEPIFGTSTMRIYWSVGFVLLAALVGISAWATPARPLEEAAREAAPDSAGYRPTRADRLAWITLAALPSGLLTAWTLWVCTVILPVPLLWTLPLTLYLLTLVIAFSNAGPRLTGFLAWSAPAVATLWALFTYFDLLSRNRLLAIHSVGFFWVVLTCHVLVVNRKPPVTALTTFFLDFSIGGALGGLFVALAAPRLFNGLFELPLFLLLAVLAIRHYGGPVQWWPEHQRGILFVFGIAAVCFIADQLRNSAWAVNPAAAAAVVIVIAAARRKDVLTGAVTGGLMFWFSHLGVAQATTIEAGRSFYGAHLTLRDVRKTKHTLYHGTTYHGLQLLDPKLRRVPTTYYLEGGPVGDVLRLFGDRPRNVAIVGLGTGTMAAYARPGDEWAYFEIDPGIIELAKDERYYTFLKDARVPIRLVRGDARFTLAAEPDGAFDMIFLDAFTADAIPTHLLTKEAFELYLSKLRPGGVIAVHISNQFLNLNPVVAGAAMGLGLPGAGKFFYPDDQQKALEGAITVWTMMSPDPAKVDALVDHAGWKRFSDAGAVSWTDDYSSISKLLRFW